MTRTAVEVCNSFEITGPDGDNTMWLKIGDQGDGKQAMFNLGSGKIPIVSTVLKDFEANRNSAVDPEFEQLINDVEKPGSSLDEKALQWNVVENLRWLAQQDDRPDRVPCGELTGLFLNKVVNMFQWNVDKLRELKNAEGGEAPTLSPEPESLTEPPETPDYRFGRLIKGEHYAYARGLLVAPTHLPKALDAMEKDGWSLLAIFGETDAENVGFIFKRSMDES